MEKQIQNTGAQNTGAQNTGAQNTGAQNTGADYINFLKTLKRFHYQLVTEEEKRKLLLLNRFAPVLVRCGTVRFVCSIQYLDNMVQMVKNSGDYIRDVSIPVSELERFGLTV